MFGLTGFTAVASATAVHRPRDVVIVLDLSGSMRFQSLPGVPLTTTDSWRNSSTFASPSSLSPPRVLSMNPDPAIPPFVHYSNTPAAALIGPLPYQSSTGKSVG